MELMFPMSDSFIVHNSFRNKVIIDLVNKHKEDKILVLVKSVEHGEELSKLLCCDYFKGELDWLDD